jgi:hypothetical protein
MTPEIREHPQQYRIGHRLTAAERPDGPGSLNEEQPSTAAP